jgi:hypothetical protein
LDGARPDGSDDEMTEGQPTDAVTAPPGASPVERLAALEDQVRWLRMENCGLHAVLFQFGHYLLLSGAFVKIASGRGPELARVEAQLKLESTRLGLFLGARDAALELGERTAADYRRTVEAAAPLTQPAGADDRARRPA